LRFLTIMVRAHEVVCTTSVRSVDPQLPTRLPLGLLFDADSHRPAWVRASNRCSCSDLPSEGMSVWRRAATPLDRFVRTGTPEQSACLVDLANAVLTTGVDRGGSPRTGSPPASRASRQDKRSWTAADGPNLATEQMAGDSRRDSNGPGAVLELIKKRSVRRPRATLGATQANDLPGFRTRTNN
jgi:hypothetical protein